MYVAVKGGEKAIKNAHELLAEGRRGDMSVPELTVPQIENQMGLAVDRVMNEGSLYDRRLASIAVKQAQGDLPEAAFLIRAYRTTLSRIGFSEPLETSEMTLRRRISATFKELPGGQKLGPTYDYTHRLLDFDMEKASLRGGLSPDNTMAEFSSDNSGGSLDQHSAARDFSRGNTATTLSPESIVTVSSQGNIATTSSPENTVTFASKGNTATLPSPGNVGTDAIGMEASISRGSAGPNISDRGVEGGDSILRGAGKDAGDSGEPGKLGEGESLSENRMSRVTDILLREGLIGDTAAKENGKVPGDLTREPLKMPADRCLRLQNLARGDEGFLLSMAYSVQRGFGASGHPFSGEIRMGELEVEFIPEELGFPISIGEITVTECVMITPFIKGRKGEMPKLTTGYGLTFGYCERKAMAMAIVDRSLCSREYGEKVVYPAQDEEFVLHHSDNVESSGFVQHLKLPHYVDFQSELVLLRKMQAAHAGEEAEEEKNGLPN